MTKSKAGRPTVMTEATLALLRQAFAFGCTDREACIFAGISDNSLYDYCQINEEFREQKEALKEKPILLAKQTVNDKLSESYGNAMDYLKRKRRKEFGDNVDHTTQGDKIFDDATKEKTNASLAGYLESGG